MKKRGSKEEYKQKSLRQDHGGEKLSEAMHIPLDLTVETISRLPVKSLVRFQVVSKLWSSLTTDWIKTRSLTQPRLLIVFRHWLLKSQVLSSSTYPLYTNRNLISADKDSYTLTRGLAYSRGHCQFEYQYTQGLICCYSRSGQFEIYNPTTRQSFLLGGCNNSIASLFGYDPVEDEYKVLCFTHDQGYLCKVITFVGVRRPKKQQWRSLSTQGIWNHHPAPMSTYLCINGIMYYIAMRDFNEVVRFDVRFERFESIEMPMILGISQLEKLTLVNYQGELGCIRYNNNSAEMWIMEDPVGKREWSKITLLISPTTVIKSLGYSHRVSGVTRDGEIVIMPKTLDSIAKRLCAYFYDPKGNKTRKVEFESTLKEKELKSEMRVCIFSVPDHMENTMSLF